MTPMTGGIYLLQDDGHLIEMTEQAYDSEALLQKLLADYPSLLAGNQINPTEPRRWLLISREMPVPLDEHNSVRAAVDHLYLDQDGIPTLVEVKRSSDTRIRREVIGQMIDYAANAVVYWPLADIQARFVILCERRGVDPEQELASFLEEDIGEDNFWQAVKTNLKAGKIRLVFVADQIPTELQRAIEFLNAQMDPAEVLAIEIKQYVGQNLKTLVPRVIGQTAEARQKKATAREKRQWDEASFFEELEQRGGLEEATVARNILAWATPKVSTIQWGEGSRTGSFVPILTHHEQEHRLFATYTYGALEIYFYWYQYKPPFDAEEKRLELLARFNAIEGISISAEAISRRPSVRLSVLQNEAVLRQFLDVFDWFIGEVEAS
jgi:hypothetical protein